MKIKWLRFSKNDVEHVLFKHKFDEEFKKMRVVEVDKKGLPRRLVVSIPFLSTSTTLPRRLVVSIPFLSTSTTLPRRLVDSIPFLLTFTTLPRRLVVSIPFMPYHMFFVFVSVL
jgi:hypothetical protein